jgi:hypothetical protein
MVKGCRHLGNNAYVSTSILNKIINSRRTEKGIFALKDDEILPSKKFAMVITSSFIFMFMCLPAQTI